MATKKTKTVTEKKQLTKKPVKKTKKVVKAKVISTKSKNVEPTKASNKKVTSKKVNGKTSKKTNKKKEKVELEFPKVLEELAALKKQTEILHQENLKLLEEHGKQLSESVNYKMKTDAMLGQVLKALYIMGIYPDQIMRKCDQMFAKKVVAD